MYLSYDGTNYNGFQIQGNAPETVQAKILFALYKIFGLE